MEYTKIYEPYIKKMARLLTKDYQLREDVEQEMRLALVKSGHSEDTQLEPVAFSIIKNRGIDYLRKFLKGQIPFGDMNDIDNFLNKQ